jgi:hypothetical protein
VDHFEQALEEQDDVFAAVPLPPEVGAGFADSRPSADFVGPADRCSFPGSFHCPRRATATWYIAATDRRRRFAACGYCRGFAAAAHVAPHALLAVGVAGDREAGWLKSSACRTTRRRCTAAALGFAG